MAEGGYVASKDLYVAHCLSTRDRILEASVTNLAKGEVTSRDKSHLCQTLLPRHTEGRLARACQPWLPGHSPAFADAFADHFHQLCNYLGQECVGVSPGHPAPRVWQCAFCLLPWTLPPCQLALSQQRLLISLSRRVVKCRTVLPSGRCL